MQYQPAASPTKAQPTAAASSWPEQYGSDASSATSRSHSQPPSQQQMMQEQEQTQFAYGNYNNNQAVVSTPMCHGCGMKAGVQGGDFCSRRCAWVVAGQCPHCGKGRTDSNYVYCSRNCSYQSGQANWCSSCGVCQTTMSGACYNQLCAGAQVVDPMSGQLMHHQAFVPNSHHSNHSNYHNHRKNQNKMEFRIMNSSEVSRSGLTSMFSTMWANGAAPRIRCAVKLTASAAHRKRYLSYRSIVENQMASKNGSGGAKYGHGGEGNEQRRYFGVPVRCGLGQGESHESIMPPAAIGGQQQFQFQQQQMKANTLDSMTSLRTCQDSSCMACNIISRGFDLFSLGLGSHYCNTTSLAAAEFLEPSPKTNLKAILVGRVVVGQPELHVVDATSEMPYIQAPADPTQNHSLIITNNDTNYDGTYVFSDDAVDPQYLVLFE